jgi:hypothetical protein
MSRTTNFMILSFALLQTGNSVLSSRGNRTVAIVNGPEKYTTTADYSCLWCKIFRLQRWDMSKDLDYYNTGELSRSIQELKEWHDKNKFCCFQPPLFSIDHVILDELHLMLRISDRLTENLIKEVMEHDSEADFLKKHGDPKGVYLNKLVTVINSLGISFSVWEQSSADRKESGTYDWTSLIGSEKKKLINLLLDQLEINDILFPKTKHAVVKLWRDFGFLYR